VTLALLLSGQGAQAPDMFALTEGLAEARPVFEAAAEGLGGRDPRELVRRGSAASHANRAGQVLCVSAALAGWRLVSGAAPRRCIVAGYSVGDLAAWGVAGWMDAETVLDLAVRRAEAMDAASDPDEGLAGIRGLPLERIAALAERHGAHLAIRNAPDSGVVGGRTGTIDELCAAAIREGASRATRLDVRIASHTPRLTAATERFRIDLAEARVSRPSAAGPRLVSGLDGGTVFSADAGLDKLARQISEPIDWAACLAACDEFGATSFLELGPGHALARMAETAFPGRRVRALEDFASAEGVRSWVSQTAG
jgi:[acyl-carrier-protein] S-malonyltransferase